MITSSSRSRIHRSAGVSASLVQRSPSGTVAPLSRANLVALNSFEQNLPEPATHSSAMAWSAPGIRPAGQGEPHGVGAVVLDPLQRVDGVALGLRHLLAVLVADQPVQGDGVKRHLRLAGGVLGRVQPEHHHPDDPEEQDVVPGDQHRGRVERLQGVGLLRPAHGRERPHPGGEPGVQHVRVLCPALAGRFLIRPDTTDLAVRSVPDRDPVPPPQLPGDAPVVHVVDPVEVPGRQFRSGG